MSRRWLLPQLVASGLLGLCAACAGAAAPTEDALSPTAVTESTSVERTSTLAPPASRSQTSTTERSSTTTSPPTTALVRTGTPPPPWLGTRLLELRPGEDNGVAQPTPAELVDRRLWTTDVLPPPPDDEFSATIVTPPPDDVVVRSTWRPECPVGLEDLSWIQVSFFGFDGLFHTGEVIVHSSFADGVVDIFESLHLMRFPIEEMQVTTQQAVDAHPTGDSNNTSSFVCRTAVNSGSWSRHAHGGAIDINPFHNPYVKGDLVLPELASAYLDRTRDVPGMISPEVAVLFEELGWGWGGDWSSASDWMHFSDSGR